MTKVNVAALKRLNCFILPGRGKDCDIAYKEIYDAAYVCWRKNTQEGLRSENKEDLASKLTSDEFVRHDICICLRSGEKVVGSFPLSWFDLNFPASLDHSYFSHFPKTVIEQLQKEQRQTIMTTGTLCVNPEWRRAQFGFGISEILIGLKLKCYLQSSADLLLAVTRNNRKVNELLFRYGGVAWAEDFLSFGLSADAVVFYRDKVTSTSIPGVQDVTDYLWERRVEAKKTQEK